MLSKILNNFKEKDGAAGRTRTCDHSLRRRFANASHFDTSHRNPMLSISFRCGNGRLGLLKKTNIRPDLQTSCKKFVKTFEREAVINPASSSIYITAENKIHWQVPGSNPGRPATFYKFLQILGQPLFPTQLNAIKTR